MARSGEDAGAALSLVKEKERRRLCGKTEADGPPWALGLGGLAPAAGPRWEAMTELVVGKTGRCWSSRQGTLWANTWRPEGLGSHGQEQECFADCRRSPGRPQEGLVKRKVER